MALRNIDREIQKVRGMNEVEPKIAYVEGSQTRVMTLTEVREEMIRRTKIGKEQIQIWSRDEKEIYDSANRTHH